MRIGKRNKKKEKMNKKNLNPSLPLASILIKPTNLKVRRIS
jgi:hypothetical protein